MHVDTDVKNYFGIGFMVNGIEMKKCLRCGHEWLPRKEREPAHCPSCSRGDWDRDSSQLRQAGDPKKSAAKSKERKVQQTYVVPAGVAKGIDALMEKEKLASRGELIRRLLKAYREKDTA